MLWKLLLLLPCQSQVLPLDGLNFTWALRAYPRLMIFFFAPWCGHSRQLEPEFRRAAELLEGVAFGKVDASLEVEVAEEFGLAAYPGLFLLQKGGYEEFTGRRASQAIVDWVRGKIGPALQLVNDTQQLQDAVNQRGASSAVVAEGSTGLKEIFMRIAEKHRSWGRFIFKDGPSNRVQVFRGLDELVEGPEVDIDRQALEKELWDFIQASQLADFGEVSEENFYHYETSGAEGLLWVIFSNSTGRPCWGFQCRQQAVRHRATFRGLAERFRQLKVVYVDAAAHEEYVMGELGVSKVPVLLLQKSTRSALDGHLETWSYPLDEPIQMDPIQLWLEEVWPSH